MPKPKWNRHSPCKEMMPGTEVDLTPDGEELRCEKGDGHDGEHLSITVHSKHIILWQIKKATESGRSDIFLWRRIRPPKNGSATTGIADTNP